jgi:hypothetical protein
MVWIFGRHANTLITLLTSKKIGTPNDGVHVGSDLGCANAMEFARLAIAYPVECLFSGSVFG